MLIALSVEDRGVVMALLVVLMLWAAYEIVKNWPGYLAEIKEEEAEDDEAAI